MSWLTKIAMPFSEEQLMYGHELYENEQDTLDDLPDCPQALVLVDIQEEFNQCIHFDCDKFFRYIQKCMRNNTEFHVVYDQLGKPPDMFQRIPGVRFYEKAYGADPYEGVIDPDTNEHIEANEMEDDKIYYDQEARLEIFRSSGHEYQHIYPDMIELVDNLRGKQVLMIGGAVGECLADIMSWFELRQLPYKVLWSFTFP